MDQYISVNGRIWILWRGNNQVTIVDSMDQCISVKVYESNKEFFISVVYGPNDALNRSRLWQHLSVIGDGAWFLAGDFNVLLKLEECSRFNGNQTCSALMTEFGDCLKGLGVFDHPFIGPTFTWVNNQDASLQCRKLDRMLINNEWNVQFSDSVVEFMSPGVSDYCAIMVRRVENMEQPVKPFKFFNFWTSHSEFMEIVRASWQEIEEGNPMQVLHRKLKRLKFKLKEFNNLHFSNISGSGGFEEAAGKCTKFFVEFSEGR